MRKYLHLGLGVVLISAAVFYVVNWGVFSDQYCKAAYEAAQAAPSSGEGGNTNSEPVGGVAPGTNAVELVSKESGGGDGGVPQNGEEAAPQPFSQPPAGEAVPNASPEVGNNVELTTPEPPPTPPPPPPPPPPPQALEEMTEEQRASVNSAVESLEIQVKVLHPERFDSWYAVHWEGVYACPPNSGFPRRCEFFVGDDRDFYEATFEMHFMNEGPLDRLPGSWPLRASLQTEVYESDVQFDVKVSFKKDAAVLWAFLDERGIDFIRKAKRPQFEDRKKFAAAFVSNCAGQRALDLQTLFDALLEDGFGVDSFGKCLQNTEEPPPRDGVDPADYRMRKVHIYEDYKFCIVFENGNQPDWVTEKVYDALAGGCIPVYMGAPNVAEFVPNVENLILATDHGSMQNLAKYIIEVNNNKHIYDSYFDKPETAEYQRLVAEIASSWQCRACQVLALRKLNIPAGRNTLFA